MNLGLTTSFIIGGLLMVMIVTLNVRMGQHASEMTLHGMSQMSTENISEIIMHDFTKIGYNETGPIDDAVSIAEADRIQFESNLDNNAGGAVETVTWELSDSTLTGTKNSNHRLLTRTVGSDVTEITLGVNRFDLFYYLEGSTTPLTFPISASNRENISRIEIVLEVQPREGTGANEHFTTSSWRKVITPPNLNL
jgi:hypothetical protein